ncbi:MAG: hypothetical protein GX639_16605 [Fibrobacter sp.]|nr:hypothetical protein [Fibrobacter sp.]
MACNKWEETGLLYCSSELSEQDATLYEEHLGQCAECKSEFDLYLSEKSSFFTTDILSETPSEKVDTELKRLFTAKKQYTSTGVFSGFVRKTVYSVSFFLLGLAVVGYFTFNIQTAKNQDFAQKAQPVSEVKTLAQIDSASAMKDSLIDSAVYFSKNRGNLETNGVYPVDLK